MGGATKWAGAISSKLQLSAVSSLERLTLRTLFSNRLSGKKTKREMWSPEAIYVTKYPSLVIVK